MKKYIKPAIEIVELESNQRMADVNPAKSATSTTAGGTITTVYNIALVSASSND